MKPTKSLLLFLFVTCFAFSQNVQTTINKLKGATQAKISTNTSGFAEFVKFPANNSLELQGITLREKTFSFLEDFKEIYNLQSIAGVLKYEKEVLDNYGFKQLVLKQYYNNVPVFDARLKFHFNASNQLTAINGNIISNIKLNATPTLSLSHAAAKALSFVEEQNINFSGAPLQVIKNTLYVFPKGLVEGHVVSHHLVYEVEVRNDIDVREFLFIDAHSGQLVEQFTGIAHALDRRLYEDNTGNLIWQEGDVFPGVLDQWQQNELAASEHIYNFFNNAFGYVSYDGADAQMKTINNNPNINCPNASWNGVTANYCTGTAADDVIAHEWGHAYTQYTSGLVYAFQSGAINESYSDIWGETIDLLNSYQDIAEDFSLRTACGSSDRWRMGEDASAFGNPIRDMWYPPCNGDPGKVTDTQYSCGDADSGGVHTNSGIPNHAYALIVDGGFYNGQTITGIGFTKAAHVFWRAQSEYLTATSDFAVLADALEASCADLLGVNLEGLSTTNTSAGLSGEFITEADCLNVAKAILAVEMRIDPEACGYVPILATNNPICEQADSNPIFYEDWETGTDGWAFQQLPSNLQTWENRNWVVESNLPDGRLGNAIFAADPVIGDCGADLENGIMRLESPVITMSNITDESFEMAFNHYVSTETLWDGGNIKYSLDGGPWVLLPSSAFTVNPYNAILNTLGAGNDNPMEGEEAFTGSDGGSTSGSWGQSVVDLSLIGVVANSTIQFRWEMGTDGCNGRVGWYLDEVIVYNCATPLSVSSAAVVKNSIKVFPNPSSGKFTLQKTASINLDKAEIYDINGRLIQEINLFNMTSNKDFDISEFSSGLYFMKVFAGDSSSVLKLMKQ